MQHRPVALYFALAYGISWAVWAPAVLFSAGWLGPVPSRLLHLLGGLGPMLAAVIVTALWEGRRALSSLFGGFRVGWRWMVLAALLPAALFFLALAISTFASDGHVEWSSIGGSRELPELPRPLYWLANLVFYGVGEEVGWRGFALPRLQTGRSALSASLLIALGWAGWHLPLFVFSPGLSSLTAAGAAGWLFSLCLGSVLLTCLYNSSRGSIAAVAIFHGTLDIFMMSPVAPSVQSLMGAILTIAALALIPVFGAANLSRRRKITSVSLATRSTADEARALW